MQLNSLKNDRQIRKMQTAAGGPLFPWQLNTEWINDWKFRTTPASRSKVLSGKGVETDKQYTERRKKETTKRTWRSDVADIAHGIGEGVLALHPYTAIPYYGAKVGLDFLNGTYGWHTALNASVPLFHLSPQAVGLREATNVALEDAANTGTLNNVIKTLWNNGKLILKDIPRKSENFYRAVNKDAISDAKKYGIIRGRKSREDNYPFFGRSSEPYHDTKYVIEGTPESADWISTYKYVYNKNPEIVRLPKIPDRDYSKAYDTIIGSPESNGFLRIGAYDNEFLEGYEALPMTNGQLNVSPSSNFVYWKKHPIIGWRKYNFKQGGKMNIIEQFKQGGQVRKMQTASGGPIINGGTPFSITVKGKDRRPAWKRMYQNPNLGDTSEYYNGNILEDVIGLAPGIGDAIDAVKAADAVNNKDYTTAGFLGAGLLLPNIVEKPLKFARGLYKGYKANKIMKAAKKALDESGEKLEVDAFKSGSKPMYVTPAKGPGSNHINAISDELKDSKYLDLERPFGKDGTLTLRYYINEGKLKQTIGAYKDLYKDRLGLHTNDVDKIYNHMISNPKLLDLNVNPGTTGLLDIIGVSLGYGPKDAILFKIGYSGLNTGEKVSKEAIESMKTYGYDRTLPGIYNILKKNIERGTLGVKSTNTNGGHVGFGYIKNRLGGMLQLLKNGSGIHIKEKNKGKFTSYCGGKVTDECILKGKNSSNPAIRKRATFAANARKWKHKEGGIIIAEKGIKAGLKAKQNLTKRKAPDWDNLDRGYRYLTQDMKLPHDLAIAIMGNIVEESQGNYKAVLKNGGGRGLIQWDNQSAPTGRYGLWGKIWASVAKPANVYDSKTDTMKNYWAPWGGLKGEQVRLKFINAPLKTKTKIYAESYLRPGKPRIKDRQLSAMLLDSIYNPRIKNIIIDKEGGIIKAEDGTKFNWQSALTNVGTNLFNSYLQSRIQNNKINSEAEAAKAENEVDLNQYFWDIYLKELAKALLEEELKSKAISAMNDTVINSSPLVTLKIAYDKASKSYGNLKANLDARNKAIDAQAEAAKSSVITDAISGVIQNGLGMLKDYYGSKNNNASTTNTSTTSNSYFDNYVNTKYKKFGTFNPDGSMNMLGGTFTIKDGYKPNQPQLYQSPKLNV